MRAGREGRDPGAAERRRLLLAGAAVAFLRGRGAGGPGRGGCWPLGRPGPGRWRACSRARRERYRRAVDAGCAAMALALADALGGGHSLRGACVEAAAAFGGAAGHELRRVAAELRRRGAHGRRARGHARRGPARSASTRSWPPACSSAAPGGDLARLLRDCAAAIEEQWRLEGELRAATAQARFTGALVVLLPPAARCWPSWPAPASCAGWPARSSPPGSSASRWRSRCWRRS